MLLAVAVFVATYAGLAFPRTRLLPIGRTGVALVGAVVMVVLGVLTPQAAFAAVDLDTIALLLGMMMIAGFLQGCGLLDALGARALGGATSGAGLLVRLCLLAGVTSAVLVNDTVCLVLTPVVVATCRRRGLPFVPYLVALATSANLGSAATLVGNPQNMLVGVMSGVSFTDFLVVSGPVSVVGLLLNAAFLVWLYRGVLPVTLAPEVVDVPLGRDAVLVGGVVLGVVVAFLAGGHLGVCALGGAAVLLVARRQDGAPVFAAVDGGLLLFFAALFVVVDGLASTGLVADAWAWVAPRVSLTEPAGLALVSAALVAGSNVVSNVPLVMLVGPDLHTLGGGALGWLLLAYVTTVAGNLTLVGSVANLIVAEGARDAHELGFVEYARAGVPSTLLSLAVGVPLLVWLA